MKNLKCLGILGAIVLAASAVTGCATHAVSTAAAPASSSRELGRSEIWSAQCSRCHNLRQTTEYSREEWAVVVNHMRAVADFSGSDYRALLEYLADRTPDRGAGGGTD